MVIDMNAMNLKKEHVVPGFRTGGHMTIKDRPRKKDWKREYEMKPAIHIYEKYGFQEIKLDRYDYVRGDIAFERILE